MEAARKTCQRQKLQADFPGMVVKSCQYESGLDSPNQRFSPLTETSEPGAPTQPKEHVPGARSSGPNQTAAPSPPTPASMRPKAAASLRPTVPEVPSPLLQQHRQVFIIFHRPKVENLPLRRKQIFGLKAYPLLKLGLFPVISPFEQKLLFSPFGENPFRTLTLNAH